MTEGERVRMKQVAEHFALYAGLPRPRWGKNENADDHVIAILYLAYRYGKMDERMGV